MKFSSMNKEQLCQFIAEANVKVGYASGRTDTWIKEADGSTTISYESGSWRYHDNFFGGEPYGGREVVSFENKPVWIMIYYGWVEPHVTNIKEVYDFLQKALKLGPEDLPLRGPEELKEGNMRYANTWQGDIEGFFGEEVIYLHEEKIYRAKYLGGLVDQRPED